jgi:hypothetical protein
MAQLPAMGIMDFVQRFQSLQIQRDTSDKLLEVGPGYHAYAESVVTFVGPFDLLRADGEWSAP